MRNPAPVARGSYVRKREKTRTRLLRAAREVMAHQGVEGATIAEIAERAEVAAGTFYNYFKTREEVLDAVAAELVVEFREVMSAVLSAVDDPAERASVIVRLFIDRAREDPLWGWFMARHGPSLPILRDQTREIVRKRLLADGIRRGRFQVSSSRALTDLFVGTTTTAIRSILEGRAPATLAEEVGELVLRALGLPLGEAAKVARCEIPRLARAVTPAS